MGFPKKISQLPQAGTLKNTDLLVVVNQNDITSQTTVGSLSSVVSGDVSDLQGVMDKGSEAQGLTSTIYLSTTKDFYLQSLTSHIELEADTDIFLQAGSGDITLTTHPGAGEILLDANTKIEGDLDLCPTGTIYCDNFAGCSPIHFKSPVEFDSSVSLSADEEVNLDFTNANNVDIPTYVLIDCKNSNNKIVTLQNFSEYVGQVVTLASEGGTRWEVTLQPTFEVTSIEECCFDNLKVTNCVSGEVWNIVNYEAWPPGTDFIGSII